MGTTSPNIAGPNYSSLGVGVNASGTTGKIDDLTILLHIHHLILH